MAAEFERLVAVFETDTSRSLKPVQTLDTATAKYEATVKKAGKTVDSSTASINKQGQSTQKATKDVGAMSTAVTKLEQSTKQTGKSVDETTKKLGLMGRASQALSATTKVISGQSGGVAGTGLVPFLSNISSIIRGIPQIGQLAGAIIRPLTDAAEEGIRLNMVLEQSEIGFSQVAGSADKARGHLQNLMAFGQASPFRFEGLLESSRLMTAMGFAIDEQIPKLKIWGSAIASSGDLSEETVHRVVLAMGQMRMAGRVNAQDMLQLTNANIPGWQLLARAIGKTVAETRKMAEAGKINGKVAVEAMTSMMALDPRYKGMLDKLQDTAAGRLSALQDTLQFAQATATKGLTGNISLMLQDALGKQDLVGTIASGINAAITPASALIEASFKTVLTGSISSGFSAGIDTAKGAVKDVMMSFAGETVLGTFKGVLGIQSPSTEFIALGINSADAYRQGFLSIMDSVKTDLGESFNQLYDQLDEIQQSRGKRFINAQAQSKANLDKLIAKEPDFLPKLIAGSRKRGMNPDHLLNVMAVETSGTFNPGIKNPTSSASGLIQFMADTAKSLGTTTQALRGMSATNQLDYVFKYFDNYIKRYGALDTQGKVYAAVGAGKVASTDEGIVMQRGQAGYAGNKATWDRNMDGVIRQGEMAVAALNKLGAGVNFTVNNSPIGPGNPVPVYVADIEGGAALLNRRGRTPRADAGVEAKLSFGPEIDPSQVIAPPELLTTTTAMINPFIQMNKLTPLLTDETKNLNTELDKMSQNLSSQEWYKRATSMGGAIQQMGQFMDSVDTWSDHMTKTFVSIPDLIGSAFGQAVSNADGKMSGFLASLRANVLSAFTGIAADIVKNQVTRMSGGILQSLLGKEVYNDQGDPTGETKGGSSIFRKILGVIGIRAGGLGVGGDKQSIAVTQNTTSTDRNTLALDRNSASAMSGALAGSVTGGKGGGGIWSTLLNIGLGALGMNLHIGGGAKSPSGLLTTTPISQSMNPNISMRHLAGGGMVRAGSSVMVGDSTTGQANPEIFTPSQDGDITPMSSMKPGFALHIHNHFHTRYGRVPPESAEQASMRAVNQFDRYHRRRGFDF